MVGMKKITLYPAPHLEVRVFVSDEMTADYKECAELAKVCGGGKDCESCSWKDVKIEDLCACCMADWSKYF